MRRAYSAGAARRRAAVLGIALAVLGCTGVAAAEAVSKSATQAPNVILIVVDTLRGDRLNASRNGVPLMPTMLELAHRSWWFDRCYVQETWTLPSVTSIFTSLYPEVHGVRFSSPPRIIWRANELEYIVPRIGGNLHLLTEMLKGAGYATLGVQTNPHLQSGMGIERGFDEYVYEFAALGEWTTNTAIRLAGNANGPMFLYCHYFDPHSVYVEHPWLFEVYGPPPSATPEERALIDNITEYYVDHVYHALGLSDERQFEPFSMAAKRLVKYRYDVECAYADRQIARLFEALRFLGKLDGETVIVFTSDHGEELWEHGALGHSKTAYDEVARVPLILHLPGQGARRIPEVVETIDILPTLAAYLGLDSPPAWQGQNLVDALREDTETPPRNAAVTTVRGTRPSANLNKRTIVDANYKLIIDELAGTEELYDLARDPGEQRNIVEEAREVRDRLEARLEAHRTKNAAHPYFEQEPEYTVVDVDMLEQLESLGYIGRPSGPAPE